MSVTLTGYAPESLDGPALRAAIADIAALVRACKLAAPMRTPPQTFLSLGVASVLALTGALGCTPDGPSGATGGEPPPEPPVCNPQDAQEAHAEAVRDECGVFVRRDGSDASPLGTKDKPFRTIAHAIEIAAKSAPQAARVYLCDETFEEAIELHGGERRGAGRRGCARRERL